MVPVSQSTNSDQKSNCDKVSPDKAKQIFKLLQYFRACLFTKDKSTSIDQALLDAGVNTLAPDLKPAEVVRLIQYIQDGSNAVHSHIDRSIFLDWVISAKSYPSRVMCCTKFATLNEFSNLLKELLGKHKYLLAIENMVMVSEKGIYKIQLSKAFLECDVEPVCFQEWQEKVLGEELLVGSARGQRWLREIDGKTPLPFVLASKKLTGAYYLIKIMSYITDLKPLASQFPVPYAAYSAINISAEPTRLAIQFRNVCQLQEFVKLYGLRYGNYIVEKCRAYTSLVLTDAGVNELIIEPRCGYGKAFIGYDKEIIEFTASRAKDTFTKITPVDLWLAMPLSQKDRYYLAQYYKEHKNLAFVIELFATELKLLHLALSEKYCPILPDLASAVKLPSSELFCEFPDIKKVLEEVKSVCESYRQREQDAEQNSKTLFGKLWRFAFASEQTVTSKQLPQTWKEIYEKIDSIIHMIDTLLPRDYDISPASTLAPTKKL